jgi:uncharacterized membrane protein
MVGLVVVCAAVVPSVRRKHAAYGRSFVTLMVGVCGAVIACTAIAFATGNTIFIYVGFLICFAGITIGWRRDRRRR